MTILDTIRQYCKENNIGPRKLAQATGLTANQAQDFLEGTEPRYTIGKIIESWYNLQQAQHKAANR